ncbi:AAA family ATPase [Pseudomonas sp. BW16M2]|uniref:AAA family ATPase n=1 Tax=Pseudomonas sp. BW16M2 TaxID=2745489 RepID=UPI0016461BD7|nr:AAA family ATPase [Pseudomonas sp. BW16M2]MBC3437124.1 AAA family ATPase [Pseudomonas sp. BW16M2]
MQYVDRPMTPPAALSSPQAQTSRKAMLEFWQLEPQRRAQTSVPAIGFNPEEPHLLEALADMSGQRCVFCEASTKLVIHRFRPPGNALPVARSSDAHLYYVWLADAWQNLLPICQGCTPIEPQFPVRRARCRPPALDQVQAYVSSGKGLWPFGSPEEEPLLLDPTQERQFAKHLIPTLDGELLAGTTRGEQTIAIFDLNRSERRDQRYQVYQKRLEALYTCVLSGELKKIDPLVDFKSLEFGGTWYLLLRRLLEHLSVRGIGRKLAVERVRPALYKWAATPDAAALLEQARHLLQREDADLRVHGTQVRRLPPAKDAVIAIQIRNFKAIERLDLRLNEPSASTAEHHGTLAPSLVILGENATGKSSILEAIALTLVPTAVRSALNVPWADMVIDPAQLGVDQLGEMATAHVRIELTNQRWVQLSIDRQQPTHDSDLGNQQVPVFAYGAFRRYGQTSQRATAHTHVRSLFDGHPLSNPEPWLSRLHQDRFDMVIRTLRDVLAIDGEFDVIQRMPGTGALCMVTTVTDLDGSTRFNHTPLHAVSSGYRSMLAMVCDILKGLMSPTVYPGFENFQAARGVILIDEIEAHLHPRWKVQVMSRLRAALPNMTFIVTTHDPLCLRGMADGEVAVVQRIATSEARLDSQFPMVIESIAGLPAVAELRLEQLLTSDFFQMLSTDDAYTDRHLANVADLMAKRSRGDLLSIEDQQMLSVFQRDISSALPIGSSEAHRLVQQAVAEYLARRRAASSEALHALRRKAKDEILAALEDL